MFDAISPSFVIELPKVGTVSIAYAAMLASTVLEVANGGSLVSTLSWNEKVCFLYIYFTFQLILFQCGTHIMDVKFSALQKYLDEAEEADLKVARADAYSFIPINDYDDGCILSSIYDE